MKKTALIVAVVMMLAITAEVWRTRLERSVKASPQPVSSNISVRANAQVAGGISDQLAKLTGAERDAFLQKASATNARLQAWGREFVLQRVNALLAQTAWYGVQGPLTATQVIATTQLFCAYGTDRYAIWLHTADKRHRFRLEDGVVWEVMSIEGDYLRKGPREIAETPAPPWSESEAKNAFKELLRRTGFDSAALNSGTIAVEPYETDSGAKPYYIVRLNGQDRLLAEAHFRAEAGRWTPTFYNDYLKKARDPFPSFTEVAQRFL